MVLDDAAISVIANVFANLAAAWYAAVFVTPAAVRDRRVSVITLLMYLALGTVCVFIAYALVKTQS